MIASGIRSLAVTLPDTIRTNDYWSRKYPEVARKEKIWLQQKKARSQDVRGGRVEESYKSDRFLFDSFMAPYADDPFHGALERRVLQPGETTTGLAVKVARQALDIARMSPTEIDLLIANAMYPDRVGGGDAGFIAKEFDFKGGAFNVDAGCAGSLAGLLTAFAFVQSGQARNVLLISVANLSRAIDETDASSQLTGDGAGAMVISPVQSGFGLLGAKSFHTGETCGAWHVDTVHDPTGSTSGSRKIRAVMTANTMQAIRATAGPYLRRCTMGALKAAGVSLDEIKLFVFHTSFAWNVAFSAEALGVDPKRTINTYPLYGNMGPVNMLVNLHHAASTGLVRSGDLVLAYLFGGQSQAAAAVMRWGKPFLGPLPTRTKNKLAEAETRLANSKAREAVMA